MMGLVVNVEAKNQLAKLLATENIWIRHQKVRTASFDTVNRILTFPIWKDMSSQLYTMLAGHEVGHALWTDREKLSTVAKRIDKKNYRIAAAYLNIVEDARIERLIKERYPGLKRIFVDAYKELLDRNFFGTNGSDIQSRSLIDRINLHFKVGHHLSLTFSSDEQKFIEKIAHTITFNDVVEVAKEIYEYAQAREAQPEPLDLDGLDIEMDNDGESDDTEPGSGTSIEVVCTDEDDEDDEDSEGSEDQNSKPKAGKSGDEDEEDGDESKPEKGGSKSSKSEDDDDDEDSTGADEGDEDSTGADEGDEDSAGAGEDGKDENAGDGKQDSAGGEKPEDAKPQPGDESKDGKDADKDGKDPAEDGKETGKDCNGEEKDGKDSGKDSGGKKEGKKDSKKDVEGKRPADGKKKGSRKPKLGPPPAPLTQERFDEQVTDFNDTKAKENVYVTLPTPNLAEIIEDHKTVHERSRKFYTTETKRRSYYWDYEVESIDDKKKRLENAEKEYLDFFAKNKPKVDYIYQQFMMKKQADQYKRTKTHKTGSLDVLRLHAYKFDDDLFKTIAIVADGKNHGLLFIVDWSGSMQRSMPGTIEQLIVLCLFCRKANIPFEVYSLTVGGDGPAFSTKPGDLDFTESFKMRVYLSSRMNTKEFHDACVNLFALMPGRVWKGGCDEDNLIGCTPLDESIVTAVDLMKVFRQRTKAQVVNAVFLTDGLANTVNSYTDAYGRETTINDRMNFLIDDRATHKVYEFSKNEMTPTLLRLLRDRQDINVVGFYIGSQSWERFFKNLDAARKKDLTKQWKEAGFVISTEWGYSELYITTGGDNLSVKEVALKPKKLEKGDEKYVKALTNNFAEQQRAVQKQRVMLDRFVKMIA